MSETIKAVTFKTTNGFTEVFTEIQVFGFYSDEINFTKEELVGLTVEEARRLRFEKDKAYFQGGS